MNWLSEWLQDSECTSTCGVHALCMVGLQRDVQTGSRLLRRQGINLVMSLSVFLKSIWTTHGCLYILTNGKLFMLRRNITADKSVQLLRRSLKKVLCRSDYLLIKPPQNDYYAEKWWTVIFALKFEQFPCWLIGLVFPQPSFRISILNVTFMPSSVICIWLEYLPSTPAIHSRSLHCMYCIDYRSDCICQGLWWLSCVLLYIECKSELLAIATFLN